MRLGHHPVAQPEDTASGQGMHSGQAVDFQRAVKMPLAFDVIFLSVFSQQCGASPLMSKAVTTSFRNSQN